jgi:signal peptidase II
MRGMDERFRLTLPKPLGPTHAGLIAYVIAVAVVGLDQLSKAWILGAYDLPAKGSVQILPLFRLSMVWNRGVSFGMMTAHNAFGRWLLVGFALVVIVALAVWARRMERLLTAVAVGLVMGGAAGNNVIDRVRFGAVADFLDVSQIGFFPWVFNVADSAITVGVALLLIDSLITPAAASRPPVR